MSKSKTEIQVKPKPDLKAGELPKSGGTYMRDPLTGEAKLVSPPTKPRKPGPANPNPETNQSKDK